MDSRTFISGCHILHHHRVLDAYGHLSMRHPTKPDIFIMSRSIAPAKVASEDDLVEYHISDASPVDSTLAGYVERYIHSEIYKRHPSINSVIHSHSNAVIPYSITSVPLQPCFHMAGFLTHSTPIFDISKHNPDTHDLLIRNIDLGAALASYFTENPVVLMRGHGFTVTGSTVQECVLRAIYTQENAVIQSTSLLIHAAHYQGSGPKIQYLNSEEIEPTTAMTKWSAMRPWELWAREVELADLYTNDG